MDLASSTARALEGPELIREAKRAGDWGQVLTALEDILRQSTACFNMAIAACGKGKRWQHAIQVLADMSSRHFAPDAVSYNAAITACARARRWPLALRVFAGMPRAAVARDVVSHNAVIDACKIGASWRLALVYWSHMSEDSFPRSANAYNACISACKARSQWQWALWLFHDMRRARLQPTKITHSASMSACLQEGEWQVALLLFGLMRCTNAKRDTLAFNVAIHACSHSGRWRGSALRADQISFSTTMAAAHPDGRWDVALSLLLSMRAGGGVPNEVNRAGALKCFKRHGRWQVAVLAALPFAHSKEGVVARTGAISAMQLHGVWEQALSATCSAQAGSTRPDGIMMTAAISTMKGMWQRARGLLHGCGSARLKSIAAHNAALATFEARGWCHALQLALAARCAGLGLDSASFDSLMATCGHDGGDDGTCSWDQVLLLYSSMADARVSPGQRAMDAALQAAPCPELLAALPRLALRPSAAKAVIGAAPCSGLGRVAEVNCQSLRFTQSSISARFHSGQWLEAKIRALLRGSEDPEDPWFMLTVVKYGDRLLCMSNRRLYCLQSYQARAQSRDGFWDGMVLARIFEWPNFSEGPEVFEEFIRQLNNARGYRLEDVTLREGGSSNDPNARNTKSSSRSV
ncbi:Pentatricopeptide repeat-containing protein, chloroplastic [Symbiodinium microadriaticum]|uniref:Pentatricopeptide repeat-containing protein, chloroplastic n=1 Tax=Symbiodinium microadriaticum TaxID=2951 RepID=A0A1Q9DKM6_SYMMI|nr:Pentatricopeptide repeat-containing protein, chloroplastic [Symbiodinium microadriaticum]